MRLVIVDLWIKAIKHQALQVCCVWVSSVWMTFLVCFVGWQMLNPSHLLRLLTLDGIHFTCGFFCFFPPLFVLNDPSPFLSIYPAQTRQMNQNAFDSLFCFVLLSFFCMLLGADGITCNSAQCLLKTQIHHTAIAMPLQRVIRLGHDHFSNDNLINQTICEMVNNEVCHTLERAHILAINRVGYLVAVCIVT